MRSTAIKYERTSSGLSAARPIGATLARRLKNTRPLTALSEDMPVAAWSQDGTHIAFLGGGSASSAEAGVTVLRPGRKELRRLTTQPGHRGLDWAPLTSDRPPTGATR